MALVALAPEARAQDAAVTFDIPAQPVAPALVAFARQAGVRLVMSEEPSGGAQANAVRGALDRDQALAMLLEGTGYRARIEDGSIRIWRMSARRAGSRARSWNGAEEADETQVTDAPPGVSPLRVGTDAEEDEIVVIGTNIRGARPASAPIEIYTAADIEQSGATTTEQFVARLPQNHGTRAQYASSSGQSLNREAVSSVDLRGLGVGTTLVLLNGRRMALADSGQAADVSTIPVSAIERVEVLTDGASAIYGSDAIGGVVNFVLRDNFDGAETRVSYGGVTSGHLRQGSVAHTLGGAWRNGGGLISLDYASASALRASDRDFSAGTVHAQGNLTPITQRYSVLGTASYDIANNLSIDVDFSVSNREVKNVIYTDALVLATPFRSETDQYFGNVVAAYALNPKLTLEVSGSYSQTQVDTNALQFNLDGGVSGVSLLDFGTQYSVLEWAAKVSGELASLPMGDVGFSLGGSFLQEDYSGSRTLDGASRSNRRLGRDTTSVFAEVLIPLLHPDHALPFANSLELSVAARYTSYEDASSPALDRDFGDRTSPKIGLAWGLASGLTLRATYAESFRAPSLSQLDPTLYRIALQAPSAIVPIGGVPSTTITLGGPSRLTNAETATSYTLGVDYRVANRLRVSATYFSIEYEDRIGTASLIPARANPGAWPEIIWRPTSAAELEELLRSGPIFFNSTGIATADLAAAAQELYARTPNLWVLENRTRNLARSELDGVDLHLSHEIETSAGAISLGGQVTRVFAFREQASPNSPIVSVVDTVTRPADLRGRLYVGHVSDGFQNTISVNYVDDYHNPLVVGGGRTTVDEWVTVDWASAYELGRTRFTLSVQNLFDQEPPRVDRASTLPRTANFDPANANPLGRVVVLGVSTRW